MTYHLFCRSLSTYGGAIECVRRGVVYGFEDQFLSYPWTLISRVGCTDPLYHV